MEHSHASLTDVKRWSGIEGDLFDTLLVYQQQYVDDVTRNDVAGEVVEMEVDRGLSSLEYSIELTLEPHQESVLAVMYFQQCRVHPSQAQLILNELDETMLQVVEAVTRNELVAKLWLLCTSHTKLIVAAAYGPQVPLPFEVLHGAFEARAVAYPIAVAIESEADRLTYGDLNAQASTLAVELAGMGIGVGSRVAVVMERCLEFPIALLAVLKVGGAMVPLDGTFPAKRLAYIIKDANVCAVISVNNFSNSLCAMELDLPTVFINSSELNAQPKPFLPRKMHQATRHDEAYLVYTSGSTGKPKGVPVLHAGAVNAMSFRCAEVGIVPGSRVMQFMAIGFDVCQWEIWKTLSAGATLVFRSKDGLTNVTDDCHF
ncbi:hypothetical protein H310_13968 [Aphanomyces invadans]|uniref:AMP-dependent synthetase/ligase domain-containing protein n=1 Tax=Aphanomyces invadans TaxID=157072 RepID=A0A024TBR5_9STRA|nr:hypothetical protein H310_13968 [Aphanomyces invadans]ETV91419.1 hypothetical protein H310_13968 [Aphanomyces invadans]|eukprot:XP_008879871.1 hypothetical protein H310_13968 [Aphanomyces invadans]